MKSRKKGRLFSLILTAAVIVTAMPALPVSAVQDTEYRDPLDHWVDSVNRTNELDVNSVVTRETSHCDVCNAQEVFRVFRVPEYTKDGVSAARSGIMFSDGTMADGKSKGEIRKGEIYTGYHWTKSVCSNCGSINTNCAPDLYAHGNNVYVLYDCAQNFTLQLQPKKTYEYKGLESHLVKEDSGEYCGLCYGTTKKHQEHLEAHTFVRTVVPQPANKRFKVVDKCSLCNFEKIEYVAAGPVVENYTGKADGKDHSIKISNYTDESVKVNVVYGTEPGKYSGDKAPSYKDAGRYPVYYQITYEWGGQSMKQEGVAYVILSGGEDKADGGKQCACGKNNCSCKDDPGKKDDSGECKCGSDCKECGCGKDGTCEEHVFKLVEKIKATCVSEGYDKYVCENCGKVEERNKTDKLPHTWDKTVIQKADCTHEGKVILICSSCGKSKVEISPKGEHSFTQHSEKATCVRPGFTILECSNCGEKHVTGITDALPHNYKEHRSEATCLAGGHINHVCDGCGSSFITDYKDALGHKFDKGTKVTGSTCTGEGVTQYECVRCGYKYISASDAAGHTPGKEATCETPQICEKCGAILKEALGHDYEKKVVEPTCEEMGYTIYTCRRCGHSYKEDYVNAAGHKPGDWIIDKKPDAENDGSRHKECEVCKKVLETEVIHKDGSVPQSDKDPYKDADSGDPDDKGVTEAHKLYMYGYPDGTFRPDGNMTRAEASAVFARLLAHDRNEKIAAPPAGSAMFFDMPSAAWFAGDVRYLMKNGIISGDTSGFFRPDDEITRSELTVMAAKFLKADSPSYTAYNGGQSSFSDVKEGYWADPYIDEAYSRGWIKGYEDGTFRGDNAITRAEMITITNNLLGRMPDSSYIKKNVRTVNPFYDLNSSHWAFCAIMEAATDHQSRVGSGREYWINIVHQNFI